MYFEAMLEKVKNPKSAANWMMGEVKGYINELAIDIQQFPVSIERMAELVNLVDEGSMGRTMASQQLFPLLVKHPDRSPHELAQEHDLIQVDDEAELRSWVNDALAKFPDKVEEYRGGKKGILGLFMGEVMRSSKGKADPKKTNQLIIEALEK